MKIKPLADRILVKNDKAETKTASGIINIQLSDTRVE